MSQRWRSFNFLGPHNDFFRKKSCFLNNLSLDHNKGNLYMACQVGPFCMEEPFVDCKCADPVRIASQSICCPTLLLTGAVIFLSPYFPKQTFVPGMARHPVSWLLRSCTAHTAHDMPTLLLSFTEAKAGAYLGVAANPT